MNNKELVEIVNNEVVTTSKQVAKVFGKEHGKVIRTIEKKIAQAKNGLSDMYALGNYKDLSGKENKMYYMNRDGLMFLAFSFTGRKVDELKLAYIDAFNTMEKKLKEQNQVAMPSYQIDDPIKRAERWIEEEKERQRLASHNEQLQIENKVQKQQINELQPKVSYYDTILASDELLSIGIIAKDYGMSAVTLNKLLNKLKVQYKCSGVWLLYAKYQDKGYTKTYTDVAVSGCQYTFTKWTQKGRLFLYELLKRNGYLPLIEQNN